MKISELKMEYGYNGKSMATVWTTLYTQQDVVDLIVWLHLIKANMKKWEKQNIAEKAK